MNEQGMILDVFVTEVDSWDLVDFLDGLTKDTSDCWSSSIAIMHFSYHGFYEGATDFDDSIAEIGGMDEPWQLAKPLSKLMTQDGAILGSLCWGAGVIGRIFATPEDETDNALLASGKKVYALSCGVDYLLGVDTNAGTSVLLENKQIWIDNRHILPVVFIPCYKREGTFRLEDPTETLLQRTVYITGYESGSKYQSLQDIAQGQS